jgi:hypothetical protein
LLAFWLQGFGIYSNMLNSSKFSGLGGKYGSDVQQRLTLEAAATHPWVLQGYGALQQESQNGQHYQLSKVTNSPVPFGMHENGSVA